MYFQFVKTIPLHKCRYEEAIHKFNLRNFCGPRVKLGVLRVIRRRDGAVNITRKVFLHDRKVFYFWCSFVFVFFNYTSYFEIIVGPHAVVSLNTERSHTHLTQFSSMIPSCKTIVQYHNQDIGIDVVKKQSISITIGSLSSLFQSHPLTYFLTLLCP